MVFIGRDIFDEFQQRFAGAAAERTKEDLNQPTPPPPPEPTPAPPPVVEDQSSGVPSLDQLRAQLFGGNPPVKMPEPPASLTANGQNAVRMPEPPADLSSGPPAVRMPATPDGTVSNPLTSIASGVPGLDELRAMAFGAPASSSTSPSAAESLQRQPDGAGVPQLSELQALAFGTPTPTAPKPQPQASMPSVAEGLERVGGGLAAANQVSQFDPSLNSDDAYAACGPAAAVRFASMYGRNPTLKEAVDMARQVGWTPGQGMAGLGSEKLLMDRMNVPTKIVQGPQWDQFAAEAQTGNPVTISTGSHYFFADGYNPTTGQFHVGRSGTDLRGGKEWMTRGEIESAASALPGGGQVQGALFADNPTVAARSSASPTPQPATQTTAALSGGGPDAGAVGDRAQQILGGAAQIGGWMGEQGQKALQAVLVTEGGMNNARGDNGQSAGPLQFFEGGQLATYARAMGMGLNQAKQYVEEHPLEAIQWAIGTATQPGYLGRAIAQGMAQGLTGPALATYAQEHGQVSVSPERAGQNWNALFGAGQSLLGNAASTVASGAQQAATDVYGNLTRTAGDLTKQAEALFAPSAATQALQKSNEEQAARLRAEQARSLEEINQQNQAMATASQAASQRSVAAAQNVAQPTIAPVTTAAAEEQPLWQRVSTAVSDALKPILEQLGAPPTAIDKATGRVLEEPQQPRITPESFEQVQQNLQQGLGHLATQAGESYSGRQVREVGGALGELERRTETPTEEQPISRLGPLGTTLGRGASTFGTLANVAGEYMSTTGNYLGDLMAASNQRAREYEAAGGPQLEQEARDLGLQLQNGDESVRPRLEEVQNQLNTLQRIPAIEPGTERPWQPEVSERRDIWYQTPTEVREGLRRVGGDIERANLTAAERAPEQEALRTSANVATAALATPLAAEGMPLAARVIAELLSPGTNPMELVQGARQLLSGPARDALGAAAKPLEEAVANYQRLQLEQAPGRREAEAAIRGIRPERLEVPEMNDAVGAIRDALQTARGELGYTAREAVGRVGRVAGTVRGLGERIGEGIPRVAEALGGAPRAGAVAEEAGRAAEAGARAAEALPPITEGEAEAAQAPRRLLEPETRTAIAEGGLGTPRYPYEEGTPEQGVAQGLREAAVADPQGVARLDSAQMAELPGMPRPAGEGVPKWQEGHAAGLDDLRVAADTGMDQATWYSKFADGAAKLVGEDNINEFRTLFGITSQQTPPDANLAYTLGFMRMAREFERDGIAFTPKNMQAWMKDNPIRLGNTEGWSQARIDRWLKDSKGKGSIDAEGNRYGGWGVGGAQLKKIQDLYTKGEVKVTSNAKTSSYSQNILSALHNLFDPNSTMDTWMAQVFNYRNSKEVANADHGFRAMREVVNHLAGELGMNPHQLQAAMWFSIKGAKDYARKKEAPKDFKQLVKSFENGQASLTEVVTRAKELGVYAPDKLAGTFEQTLSAPQVKHQVEQLRDVLELARPQIADEAHLFYPGKTKKLAYPVGPAATAERRAFAEGGAPAVAVRLGQDALDALGYNPDRRQFSAFGTIPHIVDETASGGHQVMLPGGNIDTAQYVGARIGEAAGAEEVGIHLFEPEAAELAGWQLTTADGGALSPEQAQSVRDLLDASDLQYSQPAQGIIRVHGQAVADPAYEQALADVLAASPDVHTLDLQGVIQHVGADEFPTITQRFQPRYGAARQPGVSEPGRGVGVEGLPARPPAGAGAAAAADTGRAVPAGRAGPSLESGAGAAAAEPGARPLAAPVQRVVRGPLGRPAPVGGAGAEAGGAARRPLELARAGEPAVGGERAATTAPDPLTGAQGAVRERFDPAELPVGPHAVGEEVPGAVLPDGTIATRETTWDDDDLVRTRAEMKPVPETITQYPEGHPERELQRAQWEDQLYGQGAARKEKKLDIITGLPAVGKSSIIADPLVAERGAFLADNDLAKEIIPEFDGGRGAGVVHEESSLIGDRVYRRALQAGDNIVLPMLGGKREKLDKLVDEAKALGYEVRLHLLDAPADVSARNNLERFHKRTPAAPKGRFVDTTIIESNDDKPRKAFEEFIGDRAQDLAGHSRIKNSGIGKLDMIVDQNGALPDKVQRMMRNGRVDNMPVRPPAGAGFLQTGRLPEGGAQPYLRGAVGGAVGARGEQGEGTTPQDIAAGALGGTLFAAGQKALRRGGVRVSPARVAQAIGGAGEAAGRIGGALESAVRGAPRTEQIADQAGQAGQAARGELGAAIHTAGAAGGAYAGYQTTPEEASPLERAGRTLVGAGAGLGATRAATGLAGRTPGARGTFDLDELANMRAAAARKAKAPPPPPPPGSPERADWLQGKGKWAPPKEDKPTAADHAVAYTTANMLSGLGTATQNLIGGSIQNLYRPIETAASGDFSDAARDVQAMIGGLGEHFARFGHTFKTGERYSAPIEARSKGLPGGLKNPLNYPLRMLAATDEFMRSAATAGSQASEVSRLMRENPGKTFKEVLQANKDQILEAGAKAGKEATFEEGGGLFGTLGAKTAEARQKLLNSENPNERALGLGMQWLLPMTRVPGVILGKGVRSVPVINEATGAVNIARHLKAGDTRAARREFAKTYLTTAANLAIYDQVQQGNITGDGPDNPQDRARLMEAVDKDGNPLWRPNSIKIGGRWFDHTALGPISFSMGSVANLMDTAKDYAQKPPEQRGQPPELVGELLKRQAKTVSNAWYLRNLADILGAVKDGNVAGVGQELMTSGDRLIPMGGLLNEIRRMQDPYAREPAKEFSPRAIIEREANRLPFASRTVAPRLTSTTGLPIEQPRDILSTVIRGSAPGMTPNPVAVEVSRLTEGGNRVSVPLEDEMYKGARQSVDQLRAIRETSGQAVAEYVLNTMKQPEYDKLSDPQKKDALEKAVNQAKEASNITLGGQVARSPHESALWQYATEPHYYGVRGTPEEIARQNWEISQAYAKRAEYARRYPNNFENRLRQDDPDAARLINRYEPLEQERLKALKNRVDRATGGAYFEESKQAGAGGLVGVGSTVLPARAPVGAR
jgi:zeta toxin